MPRFSKQFEELAVRHAAFAFHQSLVFAAEVEAANWAYDLEARTFSVGDRTLPMSPLGTTLPDHGVLAWCWADSSLERWPWTKDASWRLRMYGIQHDVPEFTTGGVPIGEWDDLDEAAKRITLVAMGVLGAKGANGFRMHHGGGFYVLTEDPAIPAPAEPEPALVEQVLTLVAEYFPDVDQTEVAASYVDALGGWWSQIPGGLTLRFATGGMSLHYNGNRLAWTGPSMG
ncbi:DUF6882 domain-containing protein [Pseudonocardia sp. TRM90224]|uniref:DUF6882 domain-containing protein n=1 Tax=Pseudonocardia sp. TRM90224 TaxID=2812678 RepID=UPI001E4BDA15|nr:DUF6882 domain-containing protein [Pseudonocardia sp. TRM90224]